MKRKIKVYLDTSVISAMFDEKNPERKALTENFFKKIDDFEAYVSEITVAEIDRTQDSKLRNQMRETIAGFQILSLTDEVEWVANEYVQYGAVPSGYSEDASHIAITVVNEIDYLLSWNFRHIVRRRTKDIVRMVNTLNSLKQIEIMTPAEF